VTGRRNPDTTLGQDRTQHASEASSTETRRRPIGVFDSGVGGLTVVHALRRALPGEDVVYLGDTARVPYGNKSARTVERYSLLCQQFLLNRGVKLVMIACNTASASALPALIEASPVPVLGAVEPGAASALAATRSGHIGVIGTIGTINSGAYRAAIAARDKAVHVAQLACPLFVPLAEEGWTDDEVAALVAKRYLTELFAQDAQIDTLVLGCTHYPLLKGVIGHVAADIARRPIAVVDSATAMAEAAREALGTGPHTLKNRRAEAGRLDAFTTDISRLTEIAPRFLGEPLTGFELVDL
jgi:glutamate racemase